jgi:cell division transport system permease protein
MTERASGSAPNATRKLRYARVNRKRRKTATPKPPPPAIGQISVGSPGQAVRPRVQNPIVPPRTVARRALLALVAIMSFLACLAVASVTVVIDRADGWQRQIADEVTIQIKPTEGADMEASVARAVDLAMQVPGVRAANPLSQADAAALLEPWLGANFDAEELPIPRIVAVRVDKDTDLAALAEKVRADVPGAVLDDHGAWLQRLSSMANVMTVLGLVILALVFSATALCVVFATRGAMAGSHNVIEVLHFVGAEDSYVAREFQRHFLFLGLKGAGLGCAIAVAIFLGLRLFTGLEGPTPEEAQLRSLFGGVEIGAMGYLGALLTVIVLAIIIAATARLTVRRTLTDLD